MKVIILCEAIYRITVIKMKIPMTDFTEIEKTFLKCILKYKRSWIAQKKKKIVYMTSSGEMAVLTFEVYYTVITIKAL